MRNNYHMDLSRMHTPFILLWILLLNFQVDLVLSKCINGCACEEKSVYCRDILSFSPASLPQRITNLTITRSFIGPNLGISFSPLMNLEELDLSNNGIHSIARDTFRFLSRLRKLKLSKNRLVRFDDTTFQHLSRLETLDLSYNDFFILPDVPFRFLTNLRVFNMSYNKLTSLKLGLRFQVMTKLSVLDLSGNNFSDIAANAFEMTYTWQDAVPKSVNLSFCGITSIHPETFQYPIGLKQLSLAGNLKLTTENMTSIFNSTNLQELQYLDISSMNLSDIADILVSLRGLSLSQLILNNNSISVMPVELRDNLRGLKMLSVNHNDLTSASSSITEIAGLRHLDLSHNAIIEINETFKYHLINLQTLDLSHNKLPDDSVSLENCISIYKLDLSFNLFTKFDVPDALTNLRFLNLAGNKISEIQPLSGLTSLEIFDVSANRLTELGPFIFTDSARIHIANFSGNKIEKVNHQTFKPNSPHHVDISNNSLTKLWYMGWENTKIIDLHGNRLETIDDQAFYALYSLNKLDLSGNKLISLQPNSLVYLTNLTELDLHDNHLHIPQELVRSFRPLEMLRILDMSYNNFSAILVDTFDRCKLIHTIRLSNNFLINMDPMILQNLKHLQEIDLSDNHFICNCELLEFQYWLKETKIQITYLSNTSYLCRGPKRRVKTEITQYNVDEFECNQTLLFIIIFSSIGGLVLFVAMVFALVCHFYCKWRKRRRFDFDRCSIQYEAMNKMPIANGNIANGKMYPKPHMNGVLPQHKQSRENIQREIEMLLKAKKSNGDKMKDHRTKRTQSNNRHHSNGRHGINGKIHRIPKVRSSHQRRYSDTDGVYAHIKHTRPITNQKSQHSRIGNKSRSEIDLRPYLSRGEYGALENAIIFRNARKSKDLADVVRMPHARPKLSFSVPDMLDQTHSMPRTRRPRYRSEQGELRGGNYRQQQLGGAGYQRQVRQQDIPRDRGIENDVHTVQPTVHEGYYTIGAKRSTDQPGRKSEWI